MDKKELEKLAKSILSEVKENTDSSSIFIAYYYDYKYEDFVMYYWVLESMKPHHLKINIVNGVNLQKLFAIVKKFSWRYNFKSEIVCYGEVIVLKRRCKL